MSSGPPTNDDTNTPKAAIDAGGSKDALIKTALDKLKESKKSDDDSQSMPIEGDAREELKPKTEHRTEASGERTKERERDRERSKGRDRERGRDSDREREREDTERDRDIKVKDRAHRSKDKGKDSGLFYDLSLGDGDGQMIIMPLPDTSVLQRAFLLCPMTHPQFLT